MMGILAISEYIRHGKRNVFIVFQMAALLFVLCVSASTLLAEYRLYRPFAQLNHKEGLYLSASGYHGANPDAIAKGMEKVDYVLQLVRRICFPKKLRMVLMLRYIRIK